MDILIRLPRRFDSWALSERLRWWAAHYARFPVPNRRIIEDLLEAATEVEMAASHD